MRRASHGGERRVRAAVGLVRRLVEIGLRYRLRELQLLLLPCAVALLPAVVSTGRSAAVPPIIPAILLTLAFLGSNVALSVRLPWVDQLLLPTVAMLVATHAAFDVASSPALLAGLIALYAVLGVRLVRLGVKPRAAGSRPAVRWPLYAGAALLLVATALVTTVLTVATVRFAMAAAQGT